MAFSSLYIWYKLEIEIYIDRYVDIDMYDPSKEEKKKFIDPQLSTRTFINVLILNTMVRAHYTYV